MKCCICKEDIAVHPSGWDQGNNAEPVVRKGRCCDKCNAEKVIPARLRAMGVSDAMIAKLSEKL